MLTNERHLFDVPSDIAYFNTAYFGPRLHSVNDAAISAVGLTARPWDVESDLFFDPVDRLREGVATALGGDADGVAMIPGVSYGASTAARNLIVGEGRTVVILAEQFPSNVYPWRRKVDAEGGEIVTVPRSLDGWTPGVLDAIDSRTAVVSVPHCHWTDGSVVDLVAVGAKARSVGAALCVDASQSFGALPLDVTEVQPDFLYTVGYKWQLGFYGLGYLWVAEEHRVGIPLEESWAGRKDASDFARLVDYSDSYEGGSRRFDVAERSNFIGVAIGNAAMAQINAWGVGEIAETLRMRTEAIAQGVAAHGWVAAPDNQRSPHLIGIRQPNGLPASVRESFADARVSVSVRGDSIRVSLHLHTSDEDIERLLAVLAVV